MKMINIMTMARNDKENDEVNDKYNDKYNHNDNANKTDINKRQLQRQRNDHNKYTDTGIYHRRNDTTNDTDKIEIHCQNYDKCKN